MEISENLQFYNYDVITDFTDHQPDIVAPNPSEMNFYDILRLNRKLCFKQTLVVLF